MIEKPDALLAALPLLMQSELDRREVSQRTAAAQMGLSPSTVTRVIRGGHTPDAHALLAILRWLDLSAEWLREPAVAHAAYRRGWDDCAVTVRGALGDA